MSAMEAVVADKVPRGKQDTFFFFLRFVFIGKVELQREGKTERKQDTTFCFLGLCSLPVLP